MIVFLGQECPVSNAAIPVLNQLSDEFASQGVALVGAYVDPTADLPSLRRHVADYGLRFSAADDRGQRLAALAGATYTPEAAIFSPTGQLLYRGRIDDRVGNGGVARPAAVRQDLRDAIKALIAGRTSPIPAAPGYGCALPEKLPR